MTTKLRAASFQDGAVSTAKIADDAITTDKLYTPNLGRRNLIINGAMQVAQRGTQTNQTNAYTACDRFEFTPTGATVVTTSQDTTVPSGQGFTSSLKIDVTTADSSLASGDFVVLSQTIEAQNLQHLKYGTSSAEKVTLSFWVRSPKTGTHIIELRHHDAALYNSQTYTISTADTWQNVTVTFSGYTSTAINNDNGKGFLVDWILAAGSDFTSGTLSSDTWHSTQANRAVGQVNVVDNTANNFYLTGVQLEVGSQATPFEHRSFGEELALCQRYYYHTYSYGTPAGSTFNQDYEAPIIIIGTGNHGMGVCNGVYPVEMRASPTVSFYGSDGTANRIRHWNSSSLSAYGTVNRSTRQILGMSFNAGTNTEDFYSAALVCDAEL